MRRVRVIDSHTGGEPTRVVVSGTPDLGSGPLAARCERFQTEFNWFRSAVVNEPRGSDVLVGALLVPPHDPGCSAGAIFFNNVGVLGMCGHAAMGLAVTLAHLGLVGPGAYRLDTPVGAVEVEHDGGATVDVCNVPSYRHAAGVVVPVDGVGPVAGDVAWGGNWFFLTPVPTALRLDVGSVGPLARYAARVRDALKRDGVSGSDGAVIDHVELVGPPAAPENHARNFVLCPGGAYDRSPCGTGTSAKLACLAADGRLLPQTPWRQEGILGSVFEGRYERCGDRIRPRISGAAYLTAEAELLFDPSDPFRWGVSS